MKYVSHFAGALALGALLAAGAAGCHHGFVEVSESPGVVAYYDYSYYPDAEVYYYPVEHVYFWRDGDRWERGGELPSRIHIDRDHSVAVRLQTARPYEMHAQVRTQHSGRDFAHER